MGRGIADRNMSSFFAIKLDKIGEVGQSKEDAEGRQNPQYRKLHPSAN
jgi:hypothetical protein